MKKFLKIVFALFILFVIYNTLIPFRTISSTSQLLKHIEWIPFIHQGKRASLTDIFGNILLFIPFGFLLYYVVKDKWGKSAILSITFLGFLFSLSIEIAQLFFYERTSSTQDLIMNTIGAFTGAFCGIVYFKYFSAKIFKFIKVTLRNEPLVLAVILIIGFQVIAAVVPFNISITISDLKKSVAKSNIVPFDYQPVSETFGFHNIKPNKKPVTFLVSDFLEDIIYFCLYGYLTIWCYFLYWRNKKYSQLKLAMFLLVAFPFIEFIQLFIVSRFSDINDVLAGYAGVFLGIILFYSFKQDKNIQKNLSLNFSQLKVPIALYVLFIFFTGLKPFNFSMNLNTTQSNLNMVYLVPFYSYFKKTSIWNIYDALETILSLVPLGLMLTLYFKDKMSMKFIFMVTIILSTVIGLIIEISQIFMIERIGEITDVIFFITGGYLGILSYKWYETELKPDISNDLNSQIPGSTESHS